MRGRDSELGLMGSQATLAGRFPGPSFFSKPKSYDPFVISTCALGSGQEPPVRAQSPIPYSLGFRV